jgi:hypothetical protein
MNTYQVLLTLLVIMLRVSAAELTIRININLTGLTPFLRDS